MLVVPTALVGVAPTAGAAFESIFLPDRAMAVRSSEDEIVDSDGLASWTAIVVSLSAVSSAREGGSSEASRLRISLNGSSLPFALRLAKEVRRLDDSASRGRSRRRSALISTPTVRGLMKIV